jgi:hypothetical protein
MLTQLRRRTLYLLLTALFIGGLLFGPANPVRAVSNILYVAPGASCSGTPNCYATVQAAIAAASSGNEIRVAAGTYTDIHDCPRDDVLATGTVKAVACVNKTVTIRGGYNSSFSIHNPAVNITTLNAGGNGRVMYITGAISPTIADLSLTGGDATGLGGYFYYSPTPSGYDAGGGVYIHAAVASLANNRIFSNASPEYGGGVFINNSASQLTGNTISGNTASTGGGGAVLYNSDAGLSGNHILSNTSSNLGGGLYLFDSDASLSGNSISGNTASLLGGGVDVASCSPTFDGNVFSGNAALKGGGAYLWYSHSSLTNNVFLENQAGTSGSGLWIGGSTPTLLQTTFNHNTGGDGSGLFATDNGNTPATYSTVTMKNTIVASQSVGIMATAGSTVAADGVLMYSNGAGTSGTGITLTHSYSGDPHFAADGYHLTALSAAIDKGVAAGVSADIDGQPRLGLPDLGADEFFWSIFLPLILRN